MKGGKASQVKHLFTLVQGNLLSFYRPKTHRTKSAGERTLARSIRFGTRWHSGDPLLWRESELESMLESLWRRNRLLISTPSLSIPWAAKVPLSQLKITTPWCSWLTEEPTNPWSKRLARIFTKSKLKEWTPSWDLMVTRKPTCLSQLTRMLLTLPTRSELCEWG